MFARRARPNAVETLGTSDIGSAAYSPAITENPTTYGLPPQLVVQGSGPNEAKPVYVVPRSALPDPATGGMGGSLGILGWTTGLRAIHSRFTGRIIRHRPMGVHPVQGHVGRDNRANNLWAGVQDLESKYLPDPQTIAETFVGKNRLSTSYAIEGEE